MADNQQKEKVISTKPRLKLTSVPIPEGTAARNSCLSGTAARYWYCGSLSAQRLAIGTAAQPRAIFGAKEAFLPQAYKFKELRRHIHQRNQKLDNLHTNNQRNGRRSYPIQNHTSRVQARLIEGLAAFNPSNIEVQQTPWNRRRMGSRSHTAQP